MKTRKPRILLFDIEASNLKGNFGFLHCVGYKFLGEKSVKILSNRQFKKQFKEDPTSDKATIEAFRKVYESADVVVAHYGVRFDIRFINTRCLELGLTYYPPVAFIDTWRIAKDNLALNSNRLDTIDRSCPTEKGKEPPRKTPIEQKAWVRAASGHIPSIKEIEHHCVMDIKVLENVFNRLKPLMKSFPNMAKYVDEDREGCPKCGSYNIQRRGSYLTPNGYKQRIYCSDCGSWSTVNKTAKVPEQGRTK